MSSKLLINEYPLMLLPSLACAVGLNEALLLQQIHYWIDPRISKKFFDGKYWVYNSYQQWNSQFPFWSERTLRRAINILEDKQLILCGAFNKTKFDKTKWYTINYDKLRHLEVVSTRSGQIDQIEEDKMSTSIRSNRTEDMDKMDRSYIDTETTTETTIETNSGHTPREIEYDILINKWNEAILENKSTVTLTEKRLKQVRYIFSHLFQSDLRQWENYLNTIKSSDFLMGRINNFKANFDWAIREENAIKVIEGAYSRDNHLHIDKDSDNVARANQYIDNVKDELWKSTCQFLLQMYGEDTFISWFTKLDFDRFEKDMLYLATGSSFVKDYIETQYASKIAKVVWDKVGVRCKRVVILLQSKSE